MPPLGAACERHKAEVLRPSTVVSELAEARQRSCPLLDKACREFLMTNFGEVSRCPGALKALPHPDLEQVLSSNELAVAEERTVFWGIVAWVQSNDRAVGDFESLVVHVRLALMPFEQLREIEDSEWPSQSPVLQGMLNDAFRYRAAPQEMRHEVAARLDSSQTLHRSRSFSFI